MGLKRYFFDTYAILGVIYGEPGHAKYVKEVSVATTRLNLMEAYFILLRDNGQEIAEKAYSRFLSHAIEYGDETMKEAMAFKLKNKGKGLSYVDCIGYILARGLGIPFLTGDKEFKDLPGVEYAK